MADSQMTPQDIMDRIPAAFQAEKAQGMTATFQWDISGPQGGRWYVDIKDDVCQVHSGDSGNPNITISIGDENFVKLISGQLDGTMAFMTGKLKVKGDMGLAMKLSKLFHLDS
jgi:putative sterol carrier protein